MAVYGTLLQNSTLGYPPGSCARIVSAPRCSRHRRVPASTQGSLKANNNKRMAVFCWRPSCKTASTGIPQVVGARTRLEVVAAAPAVCPSTQGITRILLTIALNLLLYVCDKPFALRTSQIGRCLGEDADLRSRIHSLSSTPTHSIRPSFPYYHSDDTIIIAHKVLLPVVWPGLRIHQNGRRPRLVYDPSCPAHGCGTVLNAVLLAA